MPARDSTHDRRQAPEWEGRMNGNRHRWRATRALVLLVACGLAVAACGGDDDSGGGGGGGGSGGGGSKSVDLAFVYPTTETNFAQEMAMGAKSAAQGLDGVHLTLAAPNNVDGPKQVQLFQAATRS